MSAFGFPDVSRNSCEGQLCINKGAQTFFCRECDCHYCDDCWTLQGPHRPGKRAPDGLPHDKIDIRVSKRYENILNNPRSREEQDALHKADGHTIWFGIDRNSADAPIFQDYQRYTNLMLQHMSIRHVTRYPQLVSFVGQTGDGKSSLIKMLIEHEEIKQDPGGGSTFPSPVGGSVNENVPTSGNVHLYAEPGSSNSKKPILYADCEGLQGGESLPGAAHSKTEDVKAASKESKVPSAVRKQLKQRTKTSSRLIRWVDSSETRKREYAVAHLYPRLLYTFSDVVVFVLRNTRTFELVLDRLLSWASACLEKSLNQPALPHAIIASNFTDMSIDSNQWDVVNATEQLMSDFDGLIDKVEKFQQLADDWRGRKKPIKTVRDLLLCYYSSIRVVRIPVKGRYMFLHEQIGKLRAEIVSGCRNAHDAKKEIRMLQNSDDLQVYLRAAFDHFSQKLDAPFNFAEVARNNHPIPKGFSGNILQLAIAAKGHPNIQLDGHMIYSELGPMVASCIFLDIVRQPLYGDPNKLLDAHYMSHCEEALRLFCHKYWPCSFHNKRGRCVNTMSGHSKGHQNSGGRVIAAGYYQSNFTYTGYIAEWRQILRVSMTEINGETQDRITASGEEEKKSASAVHYTRMNRFYSTLGPAEHFRSHSACFGCLRELPEHLLKCGHLLCTPCIGSYGTITSPGRIYLESCPLHGRQTRWRDPWPIQVKPSLAGVRVLALDGGGMRGIAELEILKEVQRHLPSKIPIQMFFDLIVGTSTGAIIALGLGAKGWSVDDCIERFKCLCTQAFTPREFHNTFLELVGALSHGGRYKTTPLTGALKESFSTTDTLFGGPPKNRNTQAKIAITSTTECGRQAVLFTNYNRKWFQKQQPDYRFERPDKPSDELCLWEVARATSAAPGYFKPFMNSRNNAGYMDGALYYNNPVRLANLERKAIWPDTTDSPPDILLSIGTGFDASKAAKELDSQSQVQPMPPKLEVLQKKKHRKLKQLRHVNKLFEALVNRMDNMIDSELTWNKFSLDVFDSDPRIRDRYLRINPDLGSNPPRLDEVNRLSKVQDMVFDQLRNDERYLHKIRESAYRLLASSFYFEKSPASRKPTCNGQILCRFPSGTPEVRYLGRYLRDKTTSSFQPHFIIAEDEPDSSMTEFPLSSDVTSYMIDKAGFSLGNISITVSSDHAVTTIELSVVSGQTFPISGFPRALLQEPSPKPRSSSLMNSDANSSELTLASSHAESDDLDLNSDAEVLDKDLYFSFKEAV